MRALLLTLTVFAFAACGGGHNPDKATDTPYEILTDSGLTQTSGDFQGSGTVRWNTPLSSAESDNNFRLKFQLNDGGSLTLIANADRRLQSGVEIKFQRNGADLSVIVTADGRSVDWGEAVREKGPLDPIQAMDVSVDIHNGATHQDYAHVLFWKNDEIEHFFDGSEDADGVPGKGRGDVWGFRLENGSLQTPSVAAARDNH